MEAHDPHAELTQFFVARIDALAHLLRASLDRGDSCFVTESLPRWLGDDLTLRLDVIPAESDPDEPPRFALTMVVDFGRYDRRMPLVSGDLATLRHFASPDDKCSALAGAVLELMAMERAGA